MNPWSEESRFPRTGESWLKVMGVAFASRATWHMLSSPLQHLILICSKLFAMGLRPSLDTVVEEKLPSEAATLLVQLNYSLLQTCHSLRATFESPYVKKLSQSQGNLTQAALHFTAVWNNQTDIFSLAWGEIILHWINMESHFVRQNLKQCQCYSSNCCPDLNLREHRAASENV